MVTDTRIAREREAMARNPRQHLEPEEGLDKSAFPEGTEDARYTEVAIEPQWMIAYKLFTDKDGEYGIPYPVPIGLWSQGANALVKMRRLDGGYAWTAVEPERLAPKGTIECVTETCGDAQVGGKRKMLKDVGMLIKHVRAFHPDDFETYKKYFDQLADQLALANPRLQKLMQASGVAASDAVADDQAVFFCPDDECTESFNTQRKLDTHARSHR